MKKIYILIFCVSATFVSCKKEQECYTCTTQSANETICKGHLQYESIVDGKTVYDNIGQPYSCH